MPKDVSKRLKVEYLMFLVLFLFYYFIIKYVYVYINIYPITEQSVRFMLRAAIPPVRLPVPLKTCESGAVKQMLVSKGLKSTLQVCAG